MEAPVLEPARRVRDGRDEEFAYPDGNSEKERLGLSGSELAIIPTLVASSVDSAPRACQAVGKKRGRLWETPIYLRQDRREEILDSLRENRAVLGKCKQVVPQVSQSHHEPILEGCCLGQVSLSSIFDQSPLNIGALFYKQSRRCQMGGVPITGPG